MKKEYFIEEPNIERKVGARVKKDTEFHFCSENVEQVIKDLKMETLLTQHGDNGTNAYTSKSLITIELNEGDILLFDETRGFYLPAIPMTTYEEAIENLSIMRDVNIPEEDFEEKKDV